MGKSDISISIYSLEDMLNTYMKQAKELDDKSQDVILNYMSELTGYSVDSLIGFIGTM